MSGLENLKTRVNYIGGTNQQDRMVLDKVRSLKKALLYSYQAATAVLSDGREFRCLMNPNKITNDEEDKIISIPFEDICLNKDRSGKTSKNVETIGMKAGDVFEWKENSTFWLVILPHTEEIAYFRSSVKRCDEVIDVDGTEYHVYVKGPTQTNIDWVTQKDFGSFNKLNYTLQMTITHNEQTEEFFHRFTQVKFLGKTWEVQAVDNISTDGIIDVYMLEYYSNTPADERDEEASSETKEAETSDIIGDDEVYPYDSKIFTINSTENGEWSVSNNKVNILSQDSSQVSLEITTGKSGEFILYYKVNDIITAQKTVKILSL